MVCASTKLSMLNIFKPLIITLWIGGMWCVGYLVTPILFANLPDKMLAGMIAGKLFYIMGIIGISAPIILFLLEKYRPSYQERYLYARRFSFESILLILLLLTAIEHFGINEMIASLKTQVAGQEIMHTVLKDQFALWHGIGSIFYLIRSILGLFLIIIMNKNKLS